MLAAICSGVLMTIVDSTSVIVALPSMETGLGFSDSSLAWVVNAYLVAYSGFLLVSGRLGDLIGHGRLFLWGVVLFTVTSLACALADSWEELLAARALQGLAGAMDVTASLSVIVNTFEDPAERAQALGIHGFATSGGGILALLLSGALTSLLGWRWIFLINVPLGVIIVAFCIVMLPNLGRHATRQPLDLGGAITITSSLTVVVYAVANADAAGWASARTLGLLLGATLLFVLFTAIEARSRAPLIPLGLFRIGNLAACCIASSLFAAAGSAGIFVSLYLQSVLGYSPLQAGVTFLPYSLLTAVISLGLSARIVIRFGVRMPLAVGLTVAAAGFVFFMRTPVRGHVFVDVLPGLVLLALGNSVAFNPMWIAGMSSVPRSQSGLVSGVIYTSSAMGGALGLAAFASASASHTRKLLAAGVGSAAALNDGYHSAFLMGSLSAAGAAVIALAFFNAQKS